MPRRLLILILFLFPFLSGGCTMIFGGKGFSPVASDERLAAFPTGQLPLQGRVELLWNEFHVPYILAEQDEDVPVVMGLVHAHLRLGQMELLRRGIRGRLSEMFGPPAVRLDEALRTLHLDRAAGQIIAELPEDSRFWLERYVAGINSYLERQPARPPEFALLAMQDEPWTVEDIVAIGRLMTVDVNWFYVFSMLGLADEPGFDRLVARLADHADAAESTFGSGSLTPLQTLVGLSRSGSNAFAVAGSRTAEGAGLLAADPHLGVNLPNFWVIMGVRSPGVRVVGLTYPGVPAVLVGRNESIAWGATNMRSINSTFYDLSEAADSVIESRRERVKVRWWFNRDVRVLDSRFGPVLSELSLLRDRSLPTVALNWRGHQPSDELTPFLKMPGISDFESFRQAFATYAVSGQNFLYADRAGNIGYVPAVEIETRRLGPAAQGWLVRPETEGHPKADAGQVLSSVDLPFVFNPDTGFLVSTNNLPFPADPPMVVSGNANDRFTRITNLLQQPGPVTVERAGNIQQDVYSAAGHRLAGALARWFNATTPEEESTVAPRRSEREQALLQAVADWDGHYQTESGGAAAYQLLVFHLGQAHFQQAYSPAIARYLLGSAVFHDLLYDDVQAGRVDPLLEDAVARAARDFQRHDTWGALHTIRVGHILAQVPLIGGRYVFGEYPIAGSSTTVMKSAHAITSRPHRMTYGQQSRFIADLSDDDQTFAVLLGGQDGWLGSPTFLDQWSLWRQGGYIQLPMREATIRQQFGYSMTLTARPASSLLR